MPWFHCPFKVLLMTAPSRRSTDSPVRNGIIIGCSTLLLGGILTVIGTMAWWSGQQIAELSKEAAANRPRFAAIEQAVLPIGGLQVQQAATTVRLAAIELAMSPLTALPAQQAATAARLESIERLLLRIEDRLNARPAGRQ